MLRFLLKVPSIVLANLVIGENVFPEFIQEDCTPEKLAGAVVPLLADTPERERQLAGLEPDRQQDAARRHDAQRKRRRNRHRADRDGIKKRLSVSR